MKAPAINEPVGIALLAVVGIGVYFVLKSQAIAAAKAIANVNAGTPYQGAGAIGTVGNVTNQVLGGAPEAVGNTLGGWLYDLLNPAYDPNNGAAVTRKQAVDGTFQNDFGTIGQDGSGAW